MTGGADFTHLADEDLHRAFTDPATTATQRQGILNEIAARGEQRLARGVSQAPVSRVVITGVDISFRNMVNLLVLIALAAIPAAIILTVIAVMTIAFLSALAHA